MPRKILYPLVCIQALIVITASQSTCIDSTTYKFYQYKGAIQYTRRCKWLTQNAAKADFRVAKFCNQFHEGSFVKDECVSSCSNCPTTSAPTVSNRPSSKPSSAPSLSPSLSSAPSSKPSSIPSKIPSSKPSSQPSTSPNPSNLSSPSPSTLPSASPSLSAGPSSKPSSLPSSFPSFSFKPSSKPSSMPFALSPQPSSAPSLSHQPSSTGSSSPSMAPTKSSSPSSVPSVCADVPGYIFYTYKKGVAYPRTCNWITNRPDKEAFRRVKFCYNGGDVLANCQKSCSAC